MSSPSTTSEIQCTSCSRRFTPRLAFQSVRENGRDAYYCSVTCRAMPKKQKSAPCAACDTAFVPVYAYQVQQVGGERHFVCSEACSKKMKAARAKPVSKATKTRVFAVLNQKGGTGKTTTSVSVAAGLAMRGRKVLLIDADPQGNVAASLGLKPRFGLYDVLTKNKDINSCLTPLFENLEVLASDERLAATEIKLAQSPGRAGLLAQKLKSLATVYDDILIDCGPSLSLLNQNVLCAADSVLIVVACDYLSLVGVKQVLKTIKNVNRHLGHRIDVGAVLPTMYDGRARICRESLESLQKHFGDKCLPPIRHNVRLKEAPSKKKTIFEHAPSSHGAQDYLTVVDLLVRRPLNEPAYVANPVAVVRGAS